MIVKNNMTRLAGILLVSLLLMGSNAWQVDAVPCQTEHCLVCDATNTTCEQCEKSYYLNEVGAECSLCQSQVGYCIDCIVNGTSIANDGEVICTVCQNGYVVRKNGALCQSCGVEIQNCQLCQLDQGISRCTSCVANRFPTIDGRSCQVCTHFVQHCSSCELVSSNGKEVKCGECEENYELSEEGKKCIEKGMATWIIVVAIVGGVLVLGVVGLVVFKSMRKKKTASTLLGEGDDD